MITDQVKKGMASHVVRLRDALDGLIKATPDMTADETLHAAKARAHAALAAFDQYIDGAAEGEPLKGR